MAMPPMMRPNHQQNLQNFMHKRHEAQWLKEQRGGAPPVPKDMLEQAAEHYRQRRFADAAALYQQLTSVPLVADQAFCNLGVIALAQGDSASAAEQFRQALVVNPSYANALYYLGEVAEKSGDLSGAVDYQRRVLVGSPSHAGAKAALARLGGSAGSSATPVALPEVSGPALTGTKLGVYEYLRADTSLLSQQTSAALVAMNFERSGAFGAWLGPLLLRLLMWGAIFVGVSVVRLSTGGDYDEDLVWALAAGHLLIFALRGVTTKYILHNGRLTVIRGVIWRRTSQIELWRIQSIDLHQGLLDRITGHGGLIIHGTSGAARKIEVRGVARGARLRQLHQELVDLVFLLRGNSVVKGIIS